MKASPLFQRYRILNELTNLRLVRDEGLPCFVLSVGPKGRRSLRFRREEDPRPALREQGRPYVYAIREQVSDSDDFSMAGENRRLSRPAIA